ncbi:MAG: extracellular solute-binding protein [Deltaproteobacteria bacterium]|nr:extracellular solute-binding protein [Deltaproteobacteria bacterium]
MKRARVVPGRSARADRRWPGLLALLAIVLAIVAFPGCAEPPRGIVVWHPYRGGEQKALESFAAKYEREANVKVTLLAIPYEAYLSKLEAAIPRGNGPDLFVSPHNRLGEYLRHQLVAPAGDAFPDADVETYEAPSVEAVTFEGKRWAVPLASKAIALYVNTDIATAPIRTMDDIAALKRSLAKDTWPLVYESQSVYFHAAILHAYGGRLFADDTFAMVGPAAEASLDRAKEITAAGLVPPEPSGDLVKQLFASGKAATAISGPWLAGDLESAKSLHYRIQPLPILEGVGPMRSYLTVEGVFLTGEGARRADVRAFARALGSEASATERAILGKQVVATRSFWARPEATSPELSVIRGFRDATATAIPMPVSVRMNPAWDPALQALRKVLRGEATAKVALDEARARFEDVMRPPPPSPSPAPLVVLLGLALLVLAFFAVRRVREPGFRRELAASKPAYKYVIHSVVVIAVLVVLPLVAGAATSFLAGERDHPQYVGLTNYIEILTVRGKPFGQWLTNGSFYLTLLVTVAWTVVNVVLHVSIGLVLGLALARPFVKLRAVYRVLLILPWAVPSYVTALAWKGMFHRQFGAVNAILSSLGVEPVSWFAKFSTAFTANVATNVWLGFPFMMVVVMGALTSIPKDVLEAAEVDGATRWQAFKLVTLPLLRPTLLPAVVLGSVWTFNMFNVVFLVSGGEPDGTTDILVSEAYRWAFARNAQFGYAAAYAVIIFGLLALMSRVLGRIGRDDSEGKEARV